MRDFLGELVALKVAILTELAIGARDPVIAMCAMSLSPDRVNVPHSDRLTACVAARFLYTFHFKPHAIKAKFMATRQLEIPIVHPVASLAFLHFCRVWGLLPIRNNSICGDLDQWQSSAFFI